MKRKYVLTLLLVAVTLVCGCTVMEEPEKVGTLFEESYLSEAPAGIQPLPEREEPENQIAAPESGCLTNNGDVCFVSNEIVLVAEENLSKADIQNIAEKYGYSVVGYVEAFALAQLRTDNGLPFETVQSVCDLLQEEEGICCAIPHYIREYVSQTYSNGDRYGDGSDADIALCGNWGVEAIGATWLWDTYPELNSVRVGIADTMFDVNHEDVSFAQLLHNDIYYNTNKDDDIASQGTFTSGIIGAKHGNGKGSDGILNSCELVGGSILGMQEGTSCLAELSLLAELSSYGIEIVNYSMGYTPELVQALSDSSPSAVGMYEDEVTVCTEAIHAFLKKGYDILLVCCAGNSGTDASLAGPFNGMDDTAAANHVLVVGAAELTDTDTYALTSYSATGDRVDVMAPGSDIYGVANRNQYMVMSGTGIAVPYATGVCAVVRAMHPDFTCEKIKKWVVDSSDIVVNGTPKLMVDLRTAASGIKITFSNVEWEYYDNVVYHPDGSEYGTEPKVHLIADNTNIEFHGYCVSNMNEGVRYRIGSKDNFEIECDIDTSTIMPHPGGYLEIVLGRISAQLNQDGGQIYLDGRSIANTGAKFHLKMTYNAGHYEVQINGKTVGSKDIDTSGKIEIRFGFIHDSHFCEVISEAYVSDITMTLQTATEISVN